MSCFRSAFCIGAAEQGHSSRDSMSTDNVQAGQQPQQQASGDQSNWQSQWQDWQWQQSWQSSYTWSGATTTDSQQADPWQWSWSRRSSIDSASASVGAGKWWETPLGWTWIRRLSGIERKWFSQLRTFAGGGVSKAALSSQIVPA